MRFVQGQGQKGDSLVILKLDLELIATESPFAPNNYLSDPNQHIKSECR